MELIKYGTIYVVEHKMHIFTYSFCTDFEMAPASWGYPHYKCSNFVLTSRSIGTEVWESLVSDIPAGDGKIAHLSYSVHCCRARLFRSILGLPFARTSHVGGAGSNPMGEMGLIPLLTLTYNINKLTFMPLPTVLYIANNHQLINDQQLVTCINIM
jgi:hypothetical protein